MKNRSPCNKCRKFFVSKRLQCLFCPQVDPFGLSLANTIKKNMGILFCFMSIFLSLVMMIDILLSAPE